MKVTIFTVLAAIFLAGCGADGEPVKPTYSANTTIGYNSSSGAFNKTTVGVHFGN